MKDLVEDPMNPNGDGNAAGELGAYARGYDDTTDESSDDHIAEVYQNLRSEKDTHEIKAESVQPEERPVRAKRARDGTPRKSGGKKTSSHEQSTSLGSGLARHSSVNDQSEDKSQFLGLDGQDDRATSNQDSQHAFDPASSTRKSSQLAILVPPTRPLEPFKQFTDHLRPQLIEDNVPSSEIGSKIDATWYDIGREGQLPWEEKYEQEMMAYEAQMDEFKKAQRASKLANGNGSSFSANK